MLGSLIGAGASIIGGLLGKSSADKQAQNQERFAKNAIQWKVQDALKAGVHPLYALGAQTTSYSPVATGDLGAGIAAAGQDISRGVAASSTEAQKLKGYTSQIHALTVQRMGLENQLLSSQIAKVNQAGTMPPAPTTQGSRYLIDGQTGSGLTGGVTTQDLLRTASDPTALQQEPGAIPDVGHARTLTGGYAPVMSHDVKQRLEEDLPGMIGWNLRNRVLPGEGAPFKAPPGKYWFFDPLRMEYRLVEDIHYKRRYPRVPPSAYR